MLAVFEIKVLFCAPSGLSSEKRAPVDGNVRAGRTLNFEDWIGWDKELLGWVIVQELCRRGGGGGILLNNALGPKFWRNRRMHANMKGSTLIFEVTSALRNY